MYFISYIFCGKNKRISKNAIKNSKRKLLKKNHH